MEKLASPPQVSMWDWFAISIQGLHRYHPCLKKTNNWIYELVDSLANKTPRSHKAMLILKGFNPETGDLTTFVEHCKRAKTTEKNSRGQVYASDE